MIRTTTIFQVGNNMVWHGCVRDSSAQNVGTTKIKQLLSHLHFPRIGEPDGRVGREWRAQTLDKFDAKTWRCVRFTRL